MGNQTSLFDSSIPDTGPIQVCPACGYTGYTLLFEEKVKCSQCYITIYDAMTFNSENDENS